MNNQEQALQLIVAYLLGRTDLSGDLEQLTVAPEMEALLARVEEIFARQDDPEWLEAIAAAEDGVMTPDLVEFLADYDRLRQFDPDLVNHFEALRAAAPDAAPLPTYPTLAAQWRAQQKKMTGVNPEQVAEDSTWQQKPGFRWRHLQAQGQLVIQLLVEALSPPGMHRAYAGRWRGEDETLFQLELAEEVEDLAVRVIAETEPDAPDQHAVTVEINIPSRGGWPHLGGTQVTLTSGDLPPQTQTTDAFGKAVFEGLTSTELVGLMIEVRE